MECQNLQGRLVRLTYTIKLKIEIRTTMLHLYRLDQFKGSWGSSRPSKSTIEVSTWSSEANGASLSLSDWKLFWESIVGMIFSIHPLHTDYYITEIMCNKGFDSIPFIHHKLVTCTKVGQATRPTPYLKTRTLISGG